MIYSYIYIDCSQWSALAADRAAWRYTVHQAVSSFETSRKEDLREKRRRRKIRAASAATSEPGQTLDCSHCGRTCLSHIGLVSHQRACNRRGQPPLFNLRYRSSAKIRTPATNKLCFTDQVKVSKDAASLLVCTRNNFLLGGCGFVMSDIISGRLLGHLGQLCLALGINR